MLQSSDSGPLLTEAAEVDTAGLETSDLATRNYKEVDGRTAGRRRMSYHLPSDLDGHEAPTDSRPVLAVFCYENPDSLVGRFVAQTAAALAKRQIVVHIFARRDFELDSAGLYCNPLGDCEGDDVIAQVQEFANRACNAFLKTFPAGSGPVTLMGHEWSAVPSLSLLCGIKHLDAVLSLHSLERQRSDMTSEISGQIEKIELAGLRMAKTVLCHDAATAEIATTHAAECQGRIVMVREMFPVQPFENQLDAGVVKARYQVGPIDPTIVYLGDLEERYGPDLLVKALPGVLKNHPQTRLIVVGAGSLYWPLRVYARYLLLEHAVRLAGSVEGQALCDLIQAADMVVVPSRESTPWWPIQAAWAARRPLVVTRPAAPGLLEHEQDGVLVYPSENSLVWGIERILFDAELRETLGVKGREKLEERFGWNVVAAQLEELMTVTAAR
jgi:glycosyltransferase involved in cell wall biosynthesis